MDTFVEQIVAIKKTAKTWALYFIIAVAAILLIALVLLFRRLFSFILVFLLALIFYGVFKLYSFMNIEYEYIVTNSTMDIDKIIAKSSRKRMISFDLSNVQRIEKFNGKLPAYIEKECFFACNPDDEAFIVYYKKEGKPQKALVFAPNERTRNAMKGFLPRHIGENL